MGLFRGIKDTFFGGAERKAANDLINFSETAVPVVSGAADFASDNLSVIADEARRTAQPLGDEALQPGGTVEAQDFENVAGQAREQQFVNSLRDRIAAGPETFQGTATGTLTDFVNAGANTDFERQEGFSDIAKAAAAGGRRAAGGTLRDLVSFNNSLNARNRGQRLSEILALSDVESRDRNFGLQERAAGLNELLLGNDVVQGARDNRLSDLLARAQSAQGRSNERFNRLFDVTQLGGRAIEGQNAARTGAASDIANIRIGQGNAKAAGRIGAANSTRGTIFDIARLATR